MLCWGFLLECLPAVDQRLQTSLAFWSSDANSLETVACMQHCIRALQSAGTGVMGRHLPWNRHLVNAGLRFAARHLRLLETWCLMDYAERGSLADSLRTGRLRRADNGAPNLACIVQCLQDIANGALFFCAQLPSQYCELSPQKSAAELCWLLPAHRNGLPAQCRHPPWGPEAGKRTPEVGF